MFHRVRVKNLKNRIQIYALTADDKWDQQLQIGTLLKANITEYVEIMLHSTSLSLVFSYDHTTEMCSWSLKGLYWDLILLCAVLLALSMLLTIAVINSSPK